MLRQKTMLPELRDDIIRLAERSEALSQSLDDGAFWPANIHVTRLQDCLVNILASSLRAFAETTVGINQSYNQQELEHLHAIRNEVRDRLKELEVDLIKDEDMQVTFESKCQSTLHQYENKLLSLSNVFTITQYILANGRYVYTILSRHSSMKLTGLHNRSGEDLALAKKVPSILAKLEDTCTHILSSDVFPPLRSTAPGTILTFMLYEARLAVSAPLRNKALYSLVCPRATFSEVTKATLEVNFRCCCANNNHDAVLAYEGNNPYIPYACR
jgi:hypothetical protein